MASSYTTQRSITLATRATAYQELATALLHFDQLDLNLVSVTVNADRTVTIVVDKPMRADQIPHLGLV